MPFAPARKFCEAGVSYFERAATQSGILWLLLLK